MRDLEKIIMEEISSLEEMRLIDAIGFVRFLKADKPITQKWVSGWFESALRSIHEKEDELKIKPDDIEKLRKRKQGNSPNG